MVDNITVAHTPGPWGTRDTHDNVTEVSSPLFEDPYNCLASVHSRWSWHDEGTDPVQEANARLIAAAPLMLEALKASVSYENALQDVEKFAYVLRETESTPEQFALLAKVCESATSLGSLFRRMRDAALVAAEPDDAARQPAAGEVS